MRNILFIFLFVFFALILQTTAVPLFFTSIGEFLHWDTLVQQTINVVFLVLMYLCFSRNFFSALVWLFAFVLMQNALGNPWKASLALSYFFSLILIYALETMFVFQYTLSSMLIIFGLILVQNMLHLALGSSALGFESPFRGEYGRLLLFSILNTLAVPFVFFILYKIDAATIFHFNKSKSFFGRRVGL